MSEKINFLARIRQFLNTSKNCSIFDISSCLSSLVKNEGCFWGVLAKIGGGGGGGGVFIYFAPLPNQPVSQHRCVNLPKADDNDRTHQNDANAPSSHMVDAFFGASTSRTNSSQ